MAGKEILARLRQFDAYPKTLDDFRIKTFGGAAGNACIVRLSRIIRSV